MRSQIEDEIVMRCVLPTRPHVVRTMDARFLNEVANDPGVRPWLGGDGALDLTPLIGDPRNVAIVTEHGGFVGEALGGGRYEVHSLFRPDGRGTTAIRAMRSAMDYLYASTDATEIVTKVPRANLAAAGLARMAGFTQLCEMSLLWTQGETVTADVFVLTLDQWIVKSVAAREMGIWLHEQFARVLAQTQSSLPPHQGEDDLHDRAAGAAVLMAHAGNASKAEWCYNRWATLTGFPKIRIVRDHPVVMDLGGMIVEVRGDAMEVLLCQ